MPLSLPRLIAARPRLFVAIAVGIVAGVITPAQWEPVGRVLAGWNAGAGFYWVLLLIMMWRADANAVRAVAARLDETAFITLVLLVVSAVMSLVAVVFELATTRATATEHSLHVLLTAITVVGTWVFVPTVFAMHYAHVYYRTSKTPPLLFPEGEIEPNYWDFLYFSFTIAVASQTADVSIASRAVRRVVLAHAVLSFVFNASILALTINISAALLTPG